MQKERRSRSSVLRAAKADVTALDVSSYEYQTHEKERRSSAVARKSKRSAPVQEERIKKEVKQRKEAREEALQKQGKLRVKRESHESTSPERKKKKRKTTGDLLAEGKLNQVQKRLQRLGVATATLSQETRTNNTGIEYFPAVKSDFTTEKEFLQEYEHIYSTQSKIIRSLEARLTDPGSHISSRDIYALSTMYSQMRETIADMRSIKDMNAQAEAIAINVFDPAMKAAGESLVNVFFKLNALLRHHIKDNTVVEILLDKIKQDISVEGSSLQNQLMISREKILETLSGA